MYTGSISIFQRSRTLVRQVIKISNPNPQIPKLKPMPQPGQAASSGPLLRVAAQKHQCFDGCAAHAPHGRLCVTIVSVASKTKSRRMRMLQVVLRLSFAAFPAPAFSRLLFDICPRKFCVLARSIDVVPLPLPGLVSCLRAHL